MNLKWIAPIVTLAWAFALPPISHGETAFACQTGKLLQVQANTGYVPFVQIGRVHRNGNKDGATGELPSTRKQTLFTVQES